MIDNPSIVGGSSPRRLLCLLVANWRRIAVDFVVLGAWVVFLAYVFLRSNYPRWAFYALLFLGVVVHSQVTGGWRTPDEMDGGRG